MKILNLFCIIAILATCSLFSACSFLPYGYEDENSRYSDLKSHYSKSFEERQLLEFPSTPNWRDVLERAFLVNGDLEAAYFDWRASLEKVRSDSEYPNSNMMLGYGYLFSKENMKSFDRSSFSLGFNPMVNLSFPSKVALSGKLAFDNALSKGQRITSMKFALQKAVLSAWTEYNGLFLKRNLQREREKLLTLLEESLLALQSAGGSQRETIQSKIRSSESKNTVFALEGKISSNRAKINGLLARSHDSELIPPSELDVRWLKANDSDVIKASINNNPELSAIAHELEGKKDALELARQQWIPDINPSALFTGAIEQSIGASIMLPTTLVKISNDIAQAKASIRANEATLRQTMLSKEATLIGTLVIVRDFERQIQLYRNILLPSAALLASTANTEYATGVTTLPESIDNQLMLLALKEELIDVEVEHAKMIYELEELMGVDIEILAVNSAGFKENHATKF